MARRTGNGSELTIEIYFCRRISFGRAFAHVLETPDAERTGRGLLELSRRLMGRHSLARGDEEIDAVNEAAADVLQQRFCPSDAIAVGADADSATGEWMLFVEKTHPGGARALAGIKPYSSGHLLLRVTAPTPELRFRRMNELLQSVCVDVKGECAVLPPVLPHVSTGDEYVDLALAAGYFNAACSAAYGCS